MKKIHDAYTPREYAFAKTLDCIRSMHGEVGGMMEGLTQSQIEAVQVQLARLHNTLLDESKLDGTALPTLLSPWETVKGEYI